MIPSKGPADELRPGEWVEVRSAEEILATLDADASLDAMPFMPEMLKACGRRFQVFKRADKTCDTIDGTGGRRLQGTVHLRDFRCDGSAHGGCEAGCLVFWREAWLKRVNDDGSQPGAHAATEAPTPQIGGCTLRSIEEAAVVDRERGIYRCQTTRLKEFTEPLAWWDVRQYVRDVAKNDVPVHKVLRALLYSTVRKATELGVGYRAVTSAADWVQSMRGEPPLPFRTGALRKTPTAELGLQPGEWVRVKPYEEILATLDTNNRNRGLYFDAEMVRYCGKVHRVVKRVHRILNERTGEMMEFSNPCIVLEDVFCRSEKSPKRLFCPRSILHYWREIWLERVEPPEAHLHDASEEQVIRIPAEKVRSATPQH